MATLCFARFFKDVRMTTLGKYCHDFPRLAKESGYCFQLHRGRVNWSEIGNVDIDDIVNNRNFELLEQNLVNVINCNLEREYDVKILDQNFVKLFQLAQLGVDYLSYCELYLDRCVILLQEQLTSYQEECESLKEEIQKKNEQLKENRKKIKAENFYQCKRCDKVFLTEMYLKSHEKRRHSSTLNTPRISETIDKSQQTEIEAHAASTQTLAAEIEISKPEESREKENEMEEMKKEHEFKMRKLEKEMEELKERLKTTEKKLTTKNEANEFAAARSYTFPNAPLFYPQMIPFLPQYMSQPANFLDSNSNYRIQQTPLKKSDPEIREHKKLVSENPSQVNDSVNFDVVLDKNLKESAILSAPPKIAPPQKKSLKSRKKLNFNKENLDPKINHHDRYHKEEEIPQEAIKPTPFPRKPKKLFGAEENVNSVKSIAPFSINSFLEEPEKKSEFSSSVDDSRNSTPVEEFEVSDEIESTIKKTPVENFAHEKEKIESRRKDLLEEDSDVGLIKEEAAPSKKQTKSFFKKMVARNSPKFQELSKNLKRSLTNLYDSVSAGKDSAAKSKADDLGNGKKSDVVEGLNKRLRELGIDPEWSGIPKKTMKQKMKTLEHRRNLLSRENPSYPSIRKKLEKNVLKRLNKNSVISEDRKSTSNESLYSDEIVAKSKTYVNAKQKEIPNNQEIRDDKRRVMEEFVNEKTPEPEESKKSKMYDFDSDSDSESEASDSQITEITRRPPSRFSTNQKFPEDEKIVNLLDVDDFDEIRIEDSKENAKEEKTEMDFSIFQVNSSKKQQQAKESPKKLEDSIEKSPKKQMTLNTLDELHTDSDFDDDFLKDFEENSFKSINEAIKSTPKNWEEKFKKNDDVKTGDKVENQSILKNSQANQAKPQSNVKKKVLFADYLTDFHQSSTTLDGIKSLAEKQKPNHLGTSKTDSGWSSDSDY